MLVGYSRVSTEDQQLTLQTQALKKCGCKNIFSDKAGGARTERPGLKEALSHLRPGDGTFFHSTPEGFCPDHGAIDNRDGARIKG